MRILPAEIKRLHSEIVKMTIMKKKKGIAEKISTSKNNKGLGRRNKEFGISRYKLLYIKQINNKVLLYSTGNYIQYLLKKEQ